MITLNPIYNNLLSKWGEKPECECCGHDMSGATVLEGRLGWYCSDKCLGESEGETGLSDFSEHQAERSQMGIQS